MSTSTELAVTTQASLPEKIEYARHLAESGLLPAHYRKQPANVLYAYEYGEMLGLAPMAAITGIHVIEGKPSASSALMSALVRRAGHRLRVSGDDEKAIAEIVRCDDPGFVFRSEWTIQRAKQAELLSKGTWKKYPAAMLKARAISECARDACEEALLGMHYTPEELGEEVGEDGAPVRVTAERVAAAESPAGMGYPGWDELIAEHEQNRDLNALSLLWKEARGGTSKPPTSPGLLAAITDAAKRVKDASSSTTAADVPLEGVIVEPQPTITERQSKRLHAILTKGDINRDTKIALLCHLTGRDITTSDELTVAEAELVNEKLTAMERMNVPLIEAIVELIDRPEAGDNQ